MSSFFSIRTSSGHGHKPSAPSKRRATRTGRLSAGAVVVSAAHRQAGRARGLATVGLRSRPPPRPGGTTPYSQSSSAPAVAAIMVLPPLLQAELRRPPPDSPQNSLAPASRARSRPGSRRLGRWRGRGSGGRIELVWAAGEASATRSTSSPPTQLPALLRLPVLAQAPTGAQCSPDVWGQPPDLGSYRLPGGRPPERLTATSAPPPPADPAWLASATPWYQPGAQRRHEHIARLRDAVA